MALVATDEAGDAGAGGDNTDVVKEPGVAGREALFSREIELFGDGHRDEGHALGMTGAGDAIRRRVQKFNVPQAGLLQPGLQV